MLLVFPDILTEVRELSVGLLLGGLAAGLLLWLAGWRTYRFWAVLTTTVLAGVFGLIEADTLNLVPVVAALLMALAAGVLALSLMRIAAFLVGGLACLLLLRLIAPGADAPVICVLAGGILSVLLFRLWMMVVTSFCGAVVLAYTLLSFLDRLGPFDSVRWCQEEGVLLNWLCLGGAIVGAAAQFYWNREARSNKPGGKEGGTKKFTGGDKGNPPKWLSMPFGKAA
jgi:hypothetical protein